jgi:E3 ubiquitin-protein ligase RHA2
VICLGDFATGDTLRRMECMHVFHKECVDKWLQQSKKCPSCNREMDL